MTDRTITVWGSAERRVQPDAAVWHAVVRGAGQARGDAYSGCAEAMTSLHATLAKAATGDAEISTGPISVWDVWDDAHTRRTGYEASGRVRIRATLDEAAGLGQLAMEAGVEELDGPLFEVSGLTAIQDGLAAEAYAAARERAEIIAAAAGVTVGAPLRISDDAEGAEGPSEPLGSPRMMRADSAMAAPIAPESRTVVSRVRVVFAITER